MKNSIQDSVIFYILWLAPAPEGESRERARWSRPELAKMLGISTPTLDKYMADFVNGGWVNKTVGKARGAFGSGYFYGLSRIGWDHVIDDFAHIQSTYKHWYLVRMKDATREIKSPSPKPKSAREEKQLSAGQRVLL
jgi:hypothetical protein